jgi:exodeoxyribonuclease (lambda-induced)
MKMLYGMKVADVEQGKASWFEARRGMVTASRIPDVMAFMPSGKESKRRANYRAELISEIVFGGVTEHYRSPEMIWGNEQEPAAREAYSLRTGLEVEQVGFVYHPTIARAGASPDGLVGNYGLLEIKNPTTKKFKQWFEQGIVPLEHRDQMYFQMACCRRDWCDFFGRDSRLPAGFNEILLRLDADCDRMLEIDDAVKQFLRELDAEMKGEKAVTQRELIEEGIDLDRGTANYKKALQDVPDFMLGKAEKFVAGDGLQYTRQELLVKPPKKPRSDKGVPRTKAPKPSAEPENLADELQGRVDSMFTEYIDAKRIIARYEELERAIAALKG